MENEDDDIEEVEDEMEAKSANDDSVNGGNEGMTAGYDLMKRLYC